MLHVMWYAFFVVRSSLIQRTWNISKNADSDSDDGTGGNNMHMRSLKVPQVQILMMIPLEWM